MKNHPLARHLLLKLTSPFLLAIIGLAMMFFVIGLHPSAINAAGNLLFVAPTGNNSGTCQVSTSPCQTIQYAINQAVAGDEIRVATGVYTGVQYSSPVTYVIHIDKSLSIGGGYTPTDWTTSDPIANPTIIDAEGKGVVGYINGEISVTIEGFILQNGNAQGTGAENGGGIWVSDSTVTLRHNIIRYNTATSNGGAIYDDGNTTLVYNTIYSNTAPNNAGGAIANTTAANTILRFNKIYSNTTNPSAGFGGALYIQGSAYVEGNIIHHNVAHFGGAILNNDSVITSVNNFIYENTADKGGGIYNTGTSITVWNNTIISNTTFITGGGLFNALGTLTLSNTIVMSNINGGIIVGITSTANATFSAIAGNTGADTIGATVTNAVSGTAMFANPAGGDFHLLPGSAMIDAGDPNTGIGIDIDEEPRPSPYGIATGFDVGADEMYENGSCYARLNDGQVYINPQTAVNDALVGDTVKLAGICTNADTSSSAAVLVVGKSITVQGGYTLTNWTARTFGPTVLDGTGVTQALSITAASAITPTIDGLHLTNATGDGLAVGGSATPRVQNNVIFGNGGNGIRNAGGAGNFRHNTIYGNGGDGFWNDTTPPTIANNILANNTGVGINSAVDLTVFANDIFGNGSVVGGAMTDPTGNNGNVSLDPAFANVAGGDFHLTLASGALGRADSSYATATDFDGDARPQGQTSDIGADEATSYPDVRFVADGNKTGIAGGADVIFSHQLTNLGSLQDTFNITFTNPSTWNVQVTPTGAVTLNSGASQTVLVTVTIPAGAPPGLATTILLTATSQSNATIFDTVTDVASVRITPGADFAPAYLNYVDPGNTIILSHVLTNTGNYTDTFAVTLTFDPANLTGDSWGTLLPTSPYTEIVAAGPYTYTLAQSQSITIRAEVTVPPFAEADLQNTFYLRAESQADQGGAPHFSTVTTDTIIANAISGNRYISPNGNDFINNCSVSSQPCATVKRGLETVSIGNTVFVARGIYTENNLKLNGNITLQGGWDDADFASRSANPSLTIIDGNGADRVLWVLNGSPLIEGFTIRNGNSSASGGGLYVDGSASPTVNGNIFHGNTANSGGGIAINSGQPLIQNNVLYNNRASFGGGLYVASAGNAQLFNNTVISNTADYGGGAYNGSGNTIISNTIVASNTATTSGGGVYNSSGTIAMDYNDFFGNSAPVYANSNAATGANSLAVAPDLTDIAGLDFHVNLSSPLVDMGDPNSGNLTDFEGDIRPVDQGFDIGADELAGCLAQIQRTGKIYGNVQQAVDIAISGDIIRLSGYCRGVHPATFGGKTLYQTVHLTKAVTLQGGWDSQFSQQNQPNVTFDAEGLGRTLLITGTVSPIIEQVTFINGNASGLGGDPSGLDAGGAIYIFNGAPRFDFNNISDSTADLGAGVYNYGGNPIFTGDKTSGRFNRIFSNTATLNGGGWYNRAGNPQFDNTFFFKNSAQNGGGFYLLGGNPNFNHDNNHLYENQAAVNGGGFFNDGGTPQFNADGIYKNTAGSNGGAFYNRSSGTFTITNMIVFSNTAGNDGGAFFNYTGSPAVWNVTIFGNNAGGSGGGWYNRAGNPQVINTILMNNSAATGGGIFDLNQGTIRRYNDVFNNTGGNYGNISAATGSVSTDPLFVNAAAGDFHLLDTSPVVDTGDPATWLTSDFDAQTRPSDQGFDIGADEFSECFAIINNDTGTVYGSIQSALDASSGVNDVIKVAGTCRGIQTRNFGAGDVNATVFVDKSRTIQGGWRTDFSQQDAVTTVDAGSRGHVFYILDGISATIEHFNIRRGTNGAIYNISTAAPTLRQSNIFSNTGATGAAIVNIGGNIIIENGNRIFNNTATIGAGFYTNGGAPVLQNNFLYGNTATDGGAIYLANGTPTIWHNTLVSNTATGGNGAGVYRAGGTPDIRNNIVMDGTGTGMHDGGGSGVLGFNIVVDNSGGDGTLSTTSDLHTRPTFVNFAGNDFHLDSASFGIDMGDPALFGLLDVDMDGDIRPSNQGMDIGADEIGGCYARINEAPPIYGSPQYAVSLASAGDTVDVAGTCTGVNTNGGSTQNLFIDKNITVRGGWKTDFSARDTVTVLDAGGNGRGVTLSISGGTPMLDRFRIINSADGAVYNVNTNGTIQNNVLYQNTAINGAGLVNASGNLAFWHNTVFSNTATGNGAGAYIFGGSPVIRNNIFAKNSATDGSAVFVAGGTPSVDYNNTWLNTGANYSGISAGANDVTGTDPLFASQNPTAADFMKLTKLSPVIDAGDPASPVGDDFENQIRPSNLGFDLGADEYAVCLAKVVSSGQIYGHPQDAVNAANAGDTIQIAGECQIRAGELQVVLVNKDLTFTGGWNETFSTRDVATSAILRGSSAVNQGRVVVVNNGVTASFETFTFTDGAADNGGAIYNDGTLTLNDPMVVMSSTATINGGAIYNTGTLYLNDDNSNDGFFIYNNTATANGGAIYNTGTLDMTGVEAPSSNTATGGDGGGIYNSGTVSIHNGLVSKNRAPLGTGGGIFNATSGVISLTNVYLGQNFASGDGGGLANAGGTATLNFSTIRENTSWGNGGGVYDTGTLTLKNAIVYSNTAVIDGGGIKSSAPTVNYTDFFQNTPNSGLASCPNCRFNQDPLFVTSWVPAVTSPVIDTADATSTLSDDCCGNGRPHNAGYDRGMYEVFLIRNALFNHNLESSTVPGDAVDGIHTKYANPGTTAVFTHILQNTGSVTDVFSITIQSSSQGWATLTSSPVVTLAKNAITNVVVSVSVPMGTIAGVTDDTVVKITSQLSTLDGAFSASADGTASYQLTDRTITNEIIDYRISNNNGTGAPGDTLTYTHIVTNAGNITDTLNIFLNPQYANMAIVSPPTLTVPISGTGMITVTVTLPNWVAGGIDDTGYVIIRPQQHPGAETAGAETTAISYITGTRYISLDGNDGDNSPDETVKWNNCTNPTVAPCRTFAHVLAQAAPGDTINVAAGTYTQTITATIGAETISQILYLDKPLTIRGGFSTADWTTSLPQTNVTTLQPTTGRGVFITGTNAITLDGLRITGGNTTGYTQNAGGAVINNGAQLTVLASEFDANGADNGGAIYSTGALTVANSIFANNFNSAIYTINGDTLVEYNTFYGNNMAFEFNGTGGGIYQNSGTLTVQSNIFITNTAAISGGAIYAATGVTTIIDTNLFFGNSAGVTGSNPITADPQLVNPAGGDFHLIKGSPAEDVGLTPLTGISDDFEREYRPQIGYDLGADERQHVPGVTIAPDYTATINSGGNIVYTHLITNTGEDTDTITLATSSSRGWANFSQVPLTVTLAAGQSVPVTVTVTVGTLGGESETSIITATSGVAQQQLGQNVFDTATDVTTVRQIFGAQFTPARNTSAIAGSVITFTHTLTNTGNGNDTFGFAASNSAGWTVALPPAVTLSPAQTRTVVVSITVPAGSGGTSSVSAITATSQISPTGATASVIDSVTVPLVRGVVIQPNGNAVGVANSTVSFEHTITNTGNAADTFDLSAVSGLGWAITLIPTQTTLSAGASADILALITIPAGTAGGITDTATITATSANDASVFDTAVDQTTVITPPVISNPPQSVTIIGVTAGVINTDYTFTAQVSPSDTTFPLTYTWQATGQSTVNHTNMSSLFDQVIFNWTTIGTKTITVTVHNAAGQVIDNHTTTIALNTVAPTAVSINGAAGGMVNHAIPFTATVAPANTTQPLTYTWQATGQTDVTHTGIVALNDSVNFAWASAGNKTITVTVSNGAGTTIDTHNITISAGGIVYLPIILKNYTPSASTPTPTPTTTATLIPTATPTGTTTITQTLYLPLVLRNYTPPTPTPGPTATNTAVPTNPPPPTATATGTPLPTPTATNTPLPTATPVAPDLVITNLSVLPNPPGNGSPATISITIKNQGPVDVGTGNNFWLDVFINPASTPSVGDIGDVFWGVQGADMTAGASKIFTATYTFSSGAVQMYGLVDSGGNIAENNESNNLFGPVGFTVAQEIPDNSDVPSGARPAGTPTPAQ